MSACDPVRPRQQKNAPPGTVLSVYFFGWILSACGTILRSRVDMMFRNAGLELPSNTVDTTSVLVVMNMLMHTDFLHVVPVDVARELSALSVAKCFR